MGEDEEYGGGVEAVQTATRGACTRYSEGMERLSV